jgi:hypothetical protein
LNCHIYQTHKVLPGIVTIQDNSLVMQCLKNGFTLVFQTALCGMLRKRLIAFKCKRFRNTRHTQHQLEYHCKALFKHPVYYLKKH